VEFGLSQCFHFVITFRVRSHFSPCAFGKNINHEEAGYTEVHRTITKNPIPMLPGEKYISTFFYRSNM